MNLLRKIAVVVLEHLTERDAELIRKVAELTTEEYDQRQRAVRAEISVQQLGSNVSALRVSLDRIRTDHAEASNITDGYARRVALEDLDLS